MNLRTVAFTLLALIAFASNSLLTRLALGSHQIDAATFTAIRLCSGAVVLVMLVRVQAGSWVPLRGRGVVGPLALFAYAAPFSFAYLRIGAAVGALVLFGVVQLTMIGYALFRGERPSVLTWVGILLATAGLALLTVPAVARPDPLGLLMMAIAGIAWGVYSLAGRTASDPIAANARSFLWGSVLALLLVAVALPGIAASGRGIALAVVSGAVTSGLGYAIWYRALPSLTVTQAAVAQLTVPVIAALAAVGLLGEWLTARLVVSGVAVLSGVAVVLWARSTSSSARPTAARDGAFERAVDRSFAFLVERYGFARKPLVVVAYERWVEFARPGVGIGIQQEMGSGPFVTLHADDGPAGLRRNFGLHELEQEMTKRGLYAPRPSAAATIDESVAQLAAVLEEIGGDVVKGDFSMLFDRQQRLVDAVVRNRPKEKETRNA